MRSFYNPPDPNEQRPTETGADFAARREFANPYDELDDLPPSQRMLEEASIVSNLPSYRGGLFERPSNARSGVDPSANVAPVDSYAEGAPGLASSATPFEPVEVRDWTYLTFCQWYASERDLDGFDALELIEKPGKFRADFEGWRDSQGELQDERRNG